MGFMPFYSSSQTLPTSGEIYDYQVGDEFHYLKVNTTWSPLDPLEEQLHCTIKKVSSRTDSTDKVSYKWSSLTLRPLQNAIGIIFQYFGYNNSSN